MVYWNLFVMVDGINVSNILFEKSLLLVCYKMVMIVVV